MVSASYVNWVRRAELEVVAPYLRAGDRILEIGAGSGQQALELAERGFEVEAVDLASSNYASSRVFPVADYDGLHIPFPDGSFDVVFSSNLLEHVADLAAMHAEVKRLLGPGGRCIHILPTGAWQFWSIVSAYPAALRQLLRARTAADLRQALRSCARAVLPARHGEVGNAFLELWLFRPGRWRRHFRDQGFDLVEDRPVGFFYTGNAFIGRRWTLERRARLAPVLGSATHLFLLRPTRERPE